MMLNLYNGIPINGVRASNGSCPKCVVRKIFSLENSRHKGIFITSHILGRLDDKTLFISSMSRIPKPHQY